MRLSLKAFAGLFGIVLLAVGVAGFVPALVPDGNLFGIFSVDPMHNGVHIATGIIGLLAATKERFARIFFIVFGIIYAIVAVLGFMGRTDLLMNMNINMADNYLHAAIAVIALLLGLFYKRNPA